MKLRSIYVVTLLLTLVILFLTSFVPSGCAYLQVDEKNGGSQGEIVSITDKHTQEETQMSNQTIEEVKAAWEERLMAMPGVMGVGIGLTQDHQQHCIKVYVNRQRSGQAEQIPQEIEGYPVEVEIRRAFRAL